jgi:phosphomannomutase
MEPTLERARAWLRDDPDEDTKKELAALLADPKANEKELEDRFAGELEFGTAGLRGVIGAGSNRMNRAVVRRATFGLGKSLLARPISVRNPRSSAPVVMIGYDGRRLSREMAEDAARVLLHMGIRVHLSHAICPTPLAAFACVKLHADAGIMVTASHNPPEYNGYKVYWGNGAQIVPPIDEDIARRIAAAPAAKDIPLGDLEHETRSGLFSIVGPEMEEAYLEGLAKLTRKGGDRDFTIVYTALHGTGHALCTTALARAGFDKVFSVPEQKDPDGAFPTVAFPNPEEKGSMDLAFALAREKKAELVLANDPDADRLAVAVPDASMPTGYLQLTGNAVGILLGHHILTRDTNGHGGAAKRLALASIVSSPMFGVVVKKLGVRFEETLTGFKWIEHRAMEVERESGEQMAFGFEEALGYSIGTLVRDKDGISAAVVFAELLAQLRGQKKTLRDRVEELFREHGLYVSGQVNVVRKGPTGPQEIGAIMKKLRAAPPKELGGLAVVATTDYEARVRVDVKSGTRTNLALPVSNVLGYELEGGSRVIARPSGTEPKAKFYFDVREDVAKTEKLADAEVRAHAKLEKVRDAFVKLTS